MTDTPTDNPAPAAPAPELSTPAPRRSHHLAEIAAVFLKLGFTAFGGPAAHVAMMDAECVSRRKWLDRGTLLDTYAALNFIPGPNSTELALALGHHRGGIPGLVVAGACFITPAVLIILPLGYLYTTYGQLPAATALLAGIAGPVVAIIAMATYRFARSVIRDPFTKTVGLLTLIIGAAGWFYEHRTRARIPQFELILMFTAAAAGFVRSRNRFITLPAVAAPLPLLLFFLKVGATLYGSGYFLVTLLDAGLVEHHGWLNARQLNDAIAVGQFTPGPLLTTATFAGYLVAHGRPGFPPGHLGAALGALLATVGIFLPSFILVTFLAPVLKRLPGYAPARGALDGANAAITALLALTCFRLAADAPHGPLGLLLLIGSFAVMLLTKLNVTWLVAAGAAAGLLAQLTHQQHWLSHW